MERYVNWVWEVLGGDGSEESGGVKVEIRVGSEREAGCLICFGLMWLDRVT